MIEHRLVDDKCCRVDDEGAQSQRSETTREDLETFLGITDFDAVQRTIVARIHQTVALNTRFYDITGQRRAPRNDT